MTVRAYFGVLALALLAACGGDQEPAIEIADAWARPTMPGQIAGVAYFTIENGGGVDRLVGFETEIAGSATLHISETVDGVSRMRALGALAIPSDAPVVLAPGGLHVMLMGLAEPLVADQMFELVLTFETVGPVPVTVVVRDGGDWSRPPDRPSHRSSDGEGEAPTGTGEPDER